MKCEQVKDCLVQYLLNELSNEVRLAIDEHLRQGCPSCLACEQEISTGIDLLFESFPNANLSSERREAIFAAAIGTHTEQLVWPQPSQPKRAKKFVGWSQTLSTVFAIAAGVLVMMVVSPIKTNTIYSQPVAKIKKQEPIQKSETFAVDLTRITHDSELAEEKYSRSILVSMQRKNDASQIEGRLLWDALSHEVHFFGKGIPKPTNGMRYVLWLLGERDQVLMTKELIVDSQGLCKATAAATTGEVLCVYITLESVLSQFDHPSKDVELTLDAKRFNMLPF